MTITIDTPDHLVRRLLDDNGLQSLEELPPLILHLLDDVATDESRERILDAVEGVDRSTSHPLTPERLDSIFDRTR